MEPKISIIIPCYNAEKYLKECLDSAINQTLKEIEIICVNDGSTDSTLQIINEYASKDNRIKVIDKVHAGISSARNTGLDVSNGEFIAFLDSDDYLDLKFYENLYNRAIETSSDIVVSEYMYRFSSNNKKKRLIFLKVDKNVITTDVEEKFKCLYLPNFGYVFNKIYRRNSLKQRFPDGINCCEDLYFSINVLAENNKMSVAKDTAYYYRNNPCSIVNTQSNINNHDYHFVYAYFFKFLEEHNINIDITKYVSTKKYKFLGITIMTVNKYCFKKTYKFMNLIEYTFPK